MTETPSIASFDDYYPPNNGDYKVSVTRIRNMVEITHYKWNSKETRWVMHNRVTTLAGTEEPIIKGYLTND